MRPADAIDRATGVSVARRQVEGLAQATAIDFDALYETDARPAAERAEVVVISADAKGVVMRPDSPRSATASAAAKASNRLKRRLSKGERGDRERMAGLGAVYTVVPVPRSPADVMAYSPDTERAPSPPPRPPTGGLAASVVESAAAVIGRVLDEACRRDPTRRCDCVALVDGSRHQIDCIHSEAKSPKIGVSVVVVLAHVPEYLRGAPWSLFVEGGPAAEEWVCDKALAVLNGSRAHAGLVVVSTRTFPPRTATSWVRWSRRAPPCSSATASPAARWSSWHGDALGARRITTAGSNSLLMGPSAAGSLRS